MFLSICGRCVGYMRLFDACDTTVSNLLLLVHNYSNHPLLHFSNQQTICRLRLFGGDVPNGRYEEVQIQYCICRKPCRVTKHDQPSDSPNEDSSDQPSDSAEEFSKKNASFA